MQRLSDAVATESEGLPPDPASFFFRCVFRETIGHRELDRAHSRLSSREVQAVQHVNRTLAQKTLGRGSKKKKPWFTLATTVGTAGHFRDTGASSRSASRSMRSTTAGSTMQSTMASRTAPSGPPPMQSTAASSASSGAGPAQWTATAASADPLGGRSSLAPGYGNTATGPLRPPAVSIGPPTYPLSKKDKKEAKKAAKQAKTEARKTIKAEKKAEKKGTTVRKGTAAIDAVAGPATTMQATTVSANASARFVVPAAPTAAPPTGAAAATTEAAPSRPPRRDEQAEAAELVITVVACHNLQPVEPAGAAAVSAFVQYEFNDVDYTTATVARTNDPTFGTVKRIRFPWTKENRAHMADTAIAFVVLDDDADDAGFFLGTAGVLLQPLADGGSIDGTFPLLDDEDKNVTGQMHVRIAWEIPVAGGPSTSDADADAEAGPADIHAIVHDLGESHM